ncbi:Ig-like domain-containing protein [Polyangium spumosum]|uniref:Cytochrome c domain-containing protein n=1 Tax=Polyangium spumosum TaxID=889282 RepID=A0A6N7PTU7_9BACT|nr:hypothetical protein [Polyangium spumosum]
MGTVMLVMALAVSAGASCGDGNEGTPPTTPEVADLELQQVKRFPVGSTYWLPNPATGGWTLEEAPAGNENQVVAGSDGFHRFTPVLPGTYVFRAETSELRRTLTVTDDVPYEHFNYYQTRSLAQVNDELWVANLFEPKITRVDPASGAVKGTIQSGPWPVAVAFAKAQGLALVAHKAGDTVGFVDVAKGRLVDAVWVGDEPADVVLSPDGAKAYVSLNTEGAVVVIDVARREVIGRVATNKSSTAMALSKDGATLYVASYLSGTSARLQFPVEERNDKYDIAVVDTKTLAVTKYIEAVGSTIGGLYLDEDRLYVATTRVALEELSGTPGMTAFRHSVAAYDTTSLAEVAAVDVGRQPSSTGFAVRPFGMALAGGTLWVSFEGSDAVVGLDPETLAEKTRFAAEGRPRTILASEDRLFVHGAQSFRVTVASSAGMPDKEIDLPGDPRSAGVAAGQYMYTGTGAGAGENHSCADCHVDALSDGNVWSAGGFSESASRPMFWMERPSMIGWEGDAYDLYSYLWGSPGPTIGATVTGELHQAFYDYLSALVPPPPANGATARDGSMSEAARRGEAIFRGKANCAGCHAGPLTTEGLRLPEGGTQTTHPIVVPPLVGAYRHGFWLVNGAAWTMEEAVDAMLKLSLGNVTDAEKKDLTRYLEELTAREFFLLNSSPRNGAVDVRSEGDLQLTFSHPVFEDPKNLASIRLTDEGGAEVPITVKAAERHVAITPAAPLAFGGKYEIVVGAGLEAWSERALVAERKIGFTVAAAPKLTLEGDYIVTVDHPTLDSMNKKYDPTKIIPVETPVKATSTPYGAVISAQVSPTLQTDVDVTIADSKSVWPPFPFRVGPGFLNRSFPTTLDLVDTDGDGVADEGESTLFLRSPGLEALDVRWTLKRPPVGPPVCDGATGTHELTLAMNGMGGPLVSWMANVNALGYFVTDPDAMTPMGPGPVTGGTTYWALSAASFPAGFAGPISYGEVPAGATDASAASGAPPGGAPLPSGSCIKLTVVFSDFTTSVMRYVAP